MVSLARPQYSSHGWEDTVEFRLLGEVSLLGHDTQVDLGAPKQRTVLVALLLADGKPLSSDALAEIVWGNSPPARWRNLLATYVCRLRRVFDTLPADIRIDRRPRGYALLLGAVPVDVRRIRDAVRQARKLVADGDDAQAVALLDDALAHTHGDPLAGLSGDWVAETAVHLHRERRDAQALRADALLRVGRTPEVIDELHRLVATHPLDEQFAAQLMTALDTEGRTAEAIACYHALRERLVDNLGLDPSPHVQQVYLAMMRRDAGAGEPLPPRPAELPADVVAFTGRAEHLAHLDRLLNLGRRTNSVVISSIAGSAGVGKTAVAVHWAHRMRHRFGDGQLYVNLRGYDKGRPLRPFEALAQFLRSLGVAPGQIPPDDAAAASLYRSLLADKRLLIILDNAYHPDQVRPLLPGSPDCLVLVTSRDSLAGLVAYDGAHLLTIDVLTPAEARALLTRVLTEHRRTVQRNHIDAIAKACAYLPLALRIAAAHLISHPQQDIAEYIGDLQSAQRLNALQIDADSRAAVRATLDLSCRQLPPATRRLFRLLGLYPGPDIAAPAAASLAGIPITRARWLLVQLTRAHLLTEHRPGRYTFHDLLRAYAAELAEAEDSNTQRRHAVHRLLDHYLHTAYAAAVQLHPPKAPIDLPPPTQGVAPEHLAVPGPATAWYKAEHLALLGVTARAADLGFDKHSWQIASIIAPFLCGQGNWHELATAQRTALAAARRLADPAAQADAHRKLAHSDGRLGHYDDARKHLQDALDLHFTLADDTGKAYVHQDLAWLFGLQRRHHKALRHARQALELYRAVGHPGGQARALNMVGWFHAQLGDFQQAVTSCSEALEVYKGLQDPNGEAYAWDSLGYAHHHLGRYHHAVSCFHRSLTLFPEHGDRLIRAEILTRLGDAHDALDDLNAAGTAWQHALTILDELRHPHAEQIRGKLQTAQGRSGH